MGKQAFLWPTLFIQQARASLVSLGVQFFIVKAKVIGKGLAYETNFIRFFAFLLQKIKSVKVQLH